MRLLCLVFPRLAIQLARRAHPELQRRPLVLLAGQGDFALVAAWSVEAAVTGVEAGMLATTARSRCPNATVLPYEAAAQLDVLEDAVSILRRRATPAVAIGGPDHVFVDLARLEAVFAGEQAAAVGLSGFVRSWTGLDVRAGVGSTRSSALVVARSALQNPVVASDDATPAERLVVEPDATLSAGTCWPESCDAREFRLRLVRLCARLETVLRAREESFRSISVEVTGPSGPVCRHALASRAPMHTASEALSLIGPALDHWRPNGITHVELSLSRLAPEFLVRPTERSVPLAQGRVRHEVQRRLVRAG